MISGQGFIVKGTRRLEEQRTKTSARAGRAVDGCADWRRCHYYRDTMVARPSKPRPSYRNADDPCPPRGALGTTSSRNCLDDSESQVKLRGRVAVRQIEGCPRFPRAAGRQAGPGSRRELVRQQTDGCELPLVCEPSFRCVRVLMSRAISASFCIHPTRRRRRCGCPNPHSHASAPRAMACMIRLSGGAILGHRQGKGFKKWVDVYRRIKCHGRDTTGRFVLLPSGNSEPERSKSSATPGPNLFQLLHRGSYKILAVETPPCIPRLWGGDLTSYIDQANIYRCSARWRCSPVNMADYTALTVVKPAEEGGDPRTPATVHQTYPATAENASWATLQGEVQEFRPTGSWENATSDNAGSAESSRMPIPRMA